MLYDGKNPILRIIGVEQLKLNSGLFHVLPRSYCALAFRIAGTATITVDGKQYLVNPNDILYLPQNLAYTAQYSETEMLVIHFITEQNDPCPEVYTVENAQQLYQAFLQAHILWQSKSQGYGVLAMSLLYNILGLICTRETSKKTPPCFQSAVSFIHAHFKETGLSVAHICRNAGISQTNFRLLFQEYYKTTPVAYITALRLEHARALIASGISIEQAAVESGFRDPKYFSRTVKKHFGCTPRQWKDYGR